ncbi:ISXO2 transposase-like protein [Vespertiliibacter pulmonis]|uniref:ISXO2 transposase-like protein n=1 Tax=Vespertiliibacter pulmonis TaxID=1443036 RepID=A0A3N4W2P8_9PAST|nr:ISXO2 transposase-like protein [Vespertiliibacter pulmonis]
MFVNAVKGIPALQLSRDLGVQYKTAYVLAQKMRKALLVQRELKSLSGEIDMDGTYIHPAPRKANKKTDRIDYRLKENQSPDKRCVIVVREHYTETEKRENNRHRGAKSTHVFVTYAETQSVVKKIADNLITRGSRINTDESNAYEILMPFYELCTVNHKDEYRSELDVTNNQAESYFSRFKRMYYGQVHKMSNRYLLNYANEAAYREDNRRQSNGVQFRDVLEKCLSTSNEKNEWCGYWQRKHISQEVVLH